MADRKKTMSKSFEQIMDARFGLNTFEYVGMLVCAAIEVTVSDMQAAEKLADKAKNDDVVGEFIDLLKELVEDVD